MAKKAVILFNLGGPDSPEAIKPFLYNLFKDPAIISLPTIFRIPLAKFIAYQRTPKAAIIYNYMGGRSPIREQTEQQANALEQQLNQIDADNQYKVFTCMRYWHPMSPEVVAAVKAYQPDELILLPLYPQYSTSTTASSIKNWYDEMERQNYDLPSHVIYCYSTNPGFIEAYTQLIAAEYQKALAYSAPRVLFSAHGLPQKRIDAGDPYEWQVNQSVKAIVERLGIDDLDYKVTYQSKVGPLKWLGPSTADEIEVAAKAKMPIVIVPIAFVSEHSETLVELDIEYKHLAEQHGCKDYFRVPTVSIESEFIAGLAQLCLDPTSSPNKMNEEEMCPKSLVKCGCRAAIS